MAQCFIGEAGGSTQWPQEVTIQCPNRDAAGTQRDDGDQVLQAVKFTDKKVPGLHLDLMKPQRLGPDGRDGDEGREGRDAKAFDKHVGRVRAAMC